MRGHVRQRGDAWEPRAFVGRDPVTGRKKYLTPTFRCGKRTAEEALSAFVVEVGGGGRAAQDATVADLLTQWFTLAEPELSPSTARGYRAVMKNYIVPTLGTVRLARLAPAQLDTFYAHLRDEGGAGGPPLAPATVSQAHTILRRALDQAVRWGWLASNPAARATPPRIRRPEIAPPEPADVLRLIEAAQPDLAVLLRTAVTTGARRGELCAPRWPDIDLEGGTVTIAHNPLEDARNQLVEKDTKTHAARRIALDPTTLRSTVSTANGWRAPPAPVARCSRPTRTCSPARSRAPGRGSPTTSPGRSSTSARASASPACASTTCATSPPRVAAGVPVRTVSGRLGHANAATMLGVYAHFVEASDREAATALGNVLDTTTLAQPRTSDVWP